MTCRDLFVLQFITQLAKQYEYKNMPEIQDANEWVCLPAASLVSLGGLIIVSSSWPPAQ